MKPIRLLVAMILVVIGSVQAYAQFALDNSLPKNPYGGTYSLTQGPPPPYRTGTYQYSNGFYGVSGISGGTVTLSGEIVFKYKWQGSVSSMPERAVVRVQSNAAWQFGSSGTADNGIGSPYVYNPPANQYISPSGDSIGHKWQVKQVNQGDGTFEVKLSPSLTTNGTATLAVIVEVYPISIRVNGVVPSNGKDNALVGLPYTAEIVGLPASAVVSGHNWSIGGALFNSWTANVDNATLDYNVSRQVPMPSWKWICGGNSDPAEDPLEDGPHDTMISVAADVTIDGQSIGSVTAYTFLDVWRPYQFMEGIFQTPPSPHWYTTSPIIDGCVADTLFNGRLGTPPLFVSGNDSGWGAFVQLVDMDNTMHRGLLKIWERNTPGYVLDLDSDDTDWPYSSPWEATITLNSNNVYVGGAGSMNDQPGLGAFVGGGIRADTYSLDFTFKTTMMYKPPGTTGAWVPSTRFEWEFNSTASDPWPATAPGVNRETWSDLTLDHPLWTGHHRSEIW